MKKVFLVIVVLAALASASAALAYTNPGKPSGFVNDFARILAPVDKAAIEAKLSNFEKETSSEISVVTVPTLGGDTIENYAVNLFKDWGIGKKSQDNGLLILVAPNEHEMRIEVGYGLEPTITDVASSVIIRNVMTPAFRNNDYVGGINGAVDTIIGLIKNDPSAVKYVNDNSNQNNSINFIPIIIFIIVFIFLLTRRGGRSLPFIFLGGGRGPRGGGFGGSGGGGFGGFGGGMSGGGGASGRW